MNSRFDTVMSMLVASTISMGTLHADHFEQFGQSQDGYMTSSTQSAGTPQTGSFGTGNYLASGFPVVLPNLPYGHTITNATFKAYLTDNGSGTLDFNGDLYAYTVTDATPTLPTGGSFFFVGDYGTDPSPTATPIMQHFVTPSSVINEYKTTDATANAALAAWAQGLVDQGVGANVFAFLRVSMDTNTTLQYLHYDFESAESYGGHPTTLTLDTAFTADPDADRVRLDLSDGFNLDGWCGVKEYRALLTNGTVSLVSAQTGQADLHVALAQGVCFVANAPLVSAVDNPTALALGQPPWAASNTNGWYVGYAASNVSLGVNPGYVGNQEGIPQDGTIVSTNDGRIYHMASHVGNATYPGDWTEVATPTCTGSGTLDKRSNVMAVFAAHSLATAQSSDRSALLPVEQQRPYSDINVVLGGLQLSTTPYITRNMEIRAVYADDSEDVLYSFPTSASIVHGPIILDSTDDEVPAGVFSPVHTFSKGFTGTTAPGSVGSHVGTLFEFTTPLALNSSKALKAIRILDVNPSLAYAPRSLLVLAATATLVPPPPPPPGTVITVR